MSHFIKKDCFGSLGGRFKSNYKETSTLQKFFLLCGAIIAVLVLVSLIVGSYGKHHQSKHAAVTFESASTPEINKIRNNTYPLGLHSNQSTNELIKIQGELNQVKMSSDQEFDSLKKQLDAVESSISTLASENEVQQLQNAVTQPNPTLLGKVDTLQTSVQKIIQQTAKVKFVSPQRVEGTFRLVAIQGFSDGMRAIVSVKGNELALSPNEIAPACQGWVLKSMSFANQSAVFQHSANEFVKLEVK